MKNRILYGWTFQRAIYLILGCFIIVQSVMEKQWFGMALGGYFASMGFFAFGCASDSCFGNLKNAESKKKLLTNALDVKFEEIKTK